MSGAISEPGSRSQDFDLNLAPIIDCLTVLITFLLASASFLSIGLLDAGIAAGANAAKDTAPPAVNITVELKGQHALSIQVSGKEKQNYVIPARGKDWDYEDMQQKLAAIHSRWPAVNAATLTAETGTEYQDVVKTMQLVRKSFPAVLLGGF